MALTVGNLYKESAGYQMKLLAGEAGFSNLVTWIHIIETIEGAGFLHGNELVITEGTICREEESLLAYAKEILTHNASGLIINTGMFIKEVPAALIAFCNENELPLFTVPWEIPLVDLTSDFCHRIVDHATREDGIAATFKNLIFNIGDKQALIHQMERYGYMSDSTMAFVCISHEPEKSSSELVNESRKITYIAEHAAKKIKDQYISFEYQEKRMVALIEYTSKEIEEYLDNVFKSLSANKLLSYIHIGIGDNMKGLEMQGNNFMRAYAANEIAKKKKECILKYQELGLYRLLVNVKNIELLSEIYHDTLGKIEEHDKENGTDYSNFIRSYIEYDGCAKEVSQNLYIHRNTVNNYIKKIEEIIGFELVSWEGKALLYTAYCIKDLL